MDKLTNWHYNIGKIMPGTARERNFEVMAMAFSFFGGIHPREHKFESCDHKIVTYPEPDVVVIPMQQHIGAPCKPLVQKGDRVLFGQKIGDNEGLCVPVHASVSGTVKEVGMKPHSSGMTVLSVVIENDHLQELHPDVRPRSGAEVEKLTPQELMSIIREAGIVGMGGAAVPTHVKLSSASGKVDTIIVNVSECEPYITSDDRLCREMPEQVLAGLQIVMRILGLQSAHIAIEDNKPEAARALREAAKPGSGIQVDVLPARYPQGAEKQLIYAVTGRQVPSGGLPAAVGCAVFNAATCKAISDAVYLGRPLTHRVVTVSGNIALEPKNLLVPIGVDINQLADAVGHTSNPYKVLTGGPMMGMAQFDLSVPVIKGTNAVTMLGFQSRFAVKNPHCIRCGKCMEVCPMGLQPLQMYRAERSQDVAALEKLHLMDCIECGCCAYTCPATIPLVQSFRAGKQRIRNAQAAKK